MCSNFIHVVCHIRCFNYTGETVFKAKTEHSEVQDAEVVVESGDTEVEKPVDLEEAEEVEEEKEEKEDTHQEQVLVL